MQGPASIFRLTSAILWLAAAFPLAAEVVSLAPAADTTLFEYAPDNNMGGAPFVTAGVTADSASNSISRGLFKFDLAPAIAVGVRINAARLVLKVTKNNPAATSATYELRRVLKDWGEGVKTGLNGQPASLGEATWNSRQAPAFAWSAPGGAAPDDFSFVSSAGLLVGGVGNYTFGPTPDLAADVQQWLDHPESNFGWILIAPDESTAPTARHFGSRQDALNAPALILDFTPAALTPSPVLYGISNTNGRFGFSFAVQTGGVYTVEYTPSLPATNWQVWSNFSSSATATNFVVEDLPNGPQRFYRVKAE